MSTVDIVKAFTDFKNKEYNLIQEIAQLRRQLKIKKKELDELYKQHKPHVSE